MGLITCPDCKQKVSDSAPACPGCGRPINQSVTSGAIRRKYQGVQALGVMMLLAGMVGCMAVVYDDGSPFISPILATAGLITYIIGRLRA